MTKKTLAKNARKNISETKTIVAKRAATPKSTVKKSTPKKNVANNVTSKPSTLRAAEPIINDSVQASGELYRFLFEASSDPIVIYDSNGNVTNANSAFEQIFGWPLDEIIGKQLGFVPKESRTETKELFERLYRDGKSVVADTKRLTKDGRTLDMQINAALITKSNGEVSGNMAIFRDTAERKQTEVALKESERRMADIIDFVPDATVMIDRQGRVIAWNRAIEEMTGVKAVEILGKGNYEYALPFYGERRPILVDLVLLPREDFEKRYAHIQRMGEILVGESYTPNLQGGEHYLYATASPLHDSNGNVTGAIETIRDITERKHTEDELQRLYQEVQREKQYLESLILNSPVAIVVMNLDGVITTWNPAAEKLFGYAQAEAIGSNIDDLVATETMQAEAVGYSKQTMDGTLVHAITQRGRKDGTLVDVELLSVPVIVARERVGAVAMYHDITELQRARHAAEAATLAKSEFLANMSHEIRTPMNGVIGMTSLVLDTALSDEQREYIETIRKSGDALLTIINDILDFSKIEAGKLELEMQPFDLRECVESAADLVAYRASEQGVELLTNIELDVPRAVIGDVTRLRQIIANLLGNAVKFTEAGEIEVAVKKEEDGIVEDEECKLHFSVRDTGIGLSRDGADRLFQVFSQMDASTTRKFGGSGLGLAICKRLTELMGGNIWAESEGIGKGSTFHFVLPFRVTEQILKASQHMPHIALREKSLLVVDDNATNRLIVNRMARSWGMSTVDCASGLEALKKLDAGLKVDAAVLDVQMPDMDGITLSGELRQRLSERELPLIIISSLGQKLPLPPGVNAAAYLHKPVKPSQLFDALVFAFDEQIGQHASPVPVETGFDAQMGERHPLRILLAEDHVVNQKVMKLMLERLGYRADVVANGLEALRSFKRRDYDVVLMDIQMPEMNGIEATRRLRVDLPPERQPRIIALTANALGGEREEYLAAGMDDYLSKPVNVATMRAALEKCMPIEIYHEIGGSHPMPESVPPPASSASLPDSGPIYIPMLKEYFPYEGEDIQMIIDLAEEFLADTERRMSQLQTYIQQGDAESVSKTAHAMKGASLTFGAKVFSALCKDIEHIGKSGNLSGAAEKMAEAQAEYARVRIELPAILKGMLP